MDPALAARLTQLIAQANAGNEAFRSAVADAERLAAAAGPAESESWIAAQQALSAAVAARRPVTQALADVDASAASQVQRNGGIGNGDLSAIQRAAGEIEEIDRRQEETIEAINRQLNR